MSYSNNFAGGICLAYKVHGSKCTSKTNRVKLSQLELGFACCSEECSEIVISTFSGSDELSKSLANSVMRHSKETLELIKGPKRTDEVQRIKDTVRQRRCFVVVAHS